jgi:glucose/arabinose dehydrogenase
MRATRDPIRGLVATLLATLVLAACSSPTGSPSPSSTSSAGASSSISAGPSLGSAGASSSAAPTASPSPTASPVVTPTARPTAVPTAVPIATPKPAATGPDHLVVEPIASGLSDPIGVTNAGDGSDRLFVVQRGGQVRVIDADGTLRAAPFVDISGRIIAGGEQGLLGLAFHPNFAANGRLFVDYTRAGDGATVISELTASADRGSANPASERILLTISQPFANHNGGQIAFGPNGYLYIGMGDGGSGGDPQGNGQNRQALLGKILRLDVDGAHAAGKEYAIPNNNPYAAGGISPGAGLPEIWAYGVRNPWRFSFDRGTGDLYIGDVGQGSWEEVDRQSAGSRGGENYGWNAFEGRHCFSNCSGVTYVPPIVEYGHALGCSITGGYVYRGSRQPALKGFYLFGDYCSGTIWTVPAAAGNQTPKAVSSTGLLISSFGQGEDGEIYLVDLGAGGLYRVVIG